MQKCFYCSKETINPKFCSRSCSVSYWNKKKAKRKSTTKVCPKCGKLKYEQSSLCQNCITEERWEKAKETEIKYYFRNNSPSRAKYNDIRVWARKILRKSGRNRECEICGFNIYVEVCHKKEIYTFPENALMGEVNSLDNLIYLCPNHHVMFDKRLLEVGAILAQSTILD